MAAGIRTTSTFSSSNLGAGGRLPSLNRFAGYDAAAINYIRAVEAADGARLEQPIRDAINAFVLGCKADGTWTALSACCILAGARTIAGALVPLVGTAPTNNSFVQADYNRVTGLKGNGSSKYLDSNRNNNADGQNSCHISVYLGGGTATAGTEMFIGCRGTNTDNTHDLYAIAASNTVNARNKSANASTGLASLTATSIGTLPGFIGNTRSGSGSFSVQAHGSTGTGTSTSASFSANIHVFQRNDLASGSALPTTTRLAFYSIGAAVDLAILRLRVMALMGAYKTELG